MPKGAKKEVNYFHLSRYACYLIIVKTITIAENESYLRQISIGVDIDVLE